MPQMNEISFNTLPESVAILNQKVDKLIILFETKQPEKQAPKIAHSIKDGAEYFHVSLPTFQAWKNKGLVSYQQQGRKLFIDLDETMKLLGNRRAGK